MKLRPPIQFPALVDHNDRLSELGDLRFRSLLSPQDWQALPSAIRRRFSKRLENGDTAIYVGKIIETNMNRIGWWLAQSLRLVGSPLPTACDCNASSVVTVTEDRTADGQIWTRLYARSSGFPQIIHSSKRFTGPTGLEEYIGCGISIALCISCEKNALVFSSHSYSIGFVRFRWKLPVWLTPGQLTVRHQAVDENRFLFSLDLHNARFGTLIHQTACYRDEGA